MPGSPYEPGIGLLSSPTDYPEKLPNCAGNFSSLCHAIQDRRVAGNHFKPLHPKFLGNFSPSRKSPQRGVAYQPRVKPWVCVGYPSCVLNERRIGVDRTQVRHSGICCVPSERGNWRTRIPRALLWAGMHCPCGANGSPPSSSTPPPPGRRKAAASGFSCVLLPKFPGNSSPHVIADRVH